MFILARALTYSAFFVGFFLIFLPSRILFSATGIVSPAVTGPWQFVGMLCGIAGAALVLACILTFVFAGKGTPAPFDPPRRLVVRGPYQFVRNPMYAGAGLALTGAAVFYQSASLFTYACVFLLVTHLFVVWFEEPVLRKTFGGDYDAYCGRAGRWWPRQSGSR